MYAADMFVKLFIFVKIVYLRYSSVNFKLAREKWKDCAGLANDEPNKDYKTALYYSFASYFLFSLF